MNTGEQTAASRHSWAITTAGVGEVARAVCLRCGTLRRTTSAKGPVEFSLTGVTWGDRIPCSGVLP